MEKYTESFRARQSLVEKLRSYSFREILERPNPAKHYRCLFKNDDTHNVKFPGTDMAIVSRVKMKLLINFYTYDIGVCKQCLTEE